MLQTLFDGTSAFGVNLQGHFQEVQILVFTTLVDFLKRYNLLGLDVLQALAIKRIHLLAIKEVFGHFGLIAQYSQYFEQLIIRVYLFYLAVLIVLCRRDRIAGGAAEQDLIVAGFVADHLLNNFRHNAASTPNVSFFIILVVLENQFWGAVVSCEANR